MRSPLREFAGSLPTDGSYSVWAGPIAGNPWLTHREAVQHYAASTMKLPLVITAYRRADEGLLDLDSMVEVHPDFASAVDAPRFTMDRDDDSDPEPWRRVGEKVTLRWLALRAIVRSSNLATNLLMEAVGPELVQQTLGALGAEHSVVSRGIEDSAARESGLHNLVTAVDLARVLRALARESAASPASCREVRDVLAAQQLRDTIPAGLPAGTRVEHKSGWVEGVFHDAGIVHPARRGPFVFVMCTTADLSEEQGAALIARGAAAAWAESEAETRG